MQAPRKGYVEITGRRLRPAETRGHPGGSPTACGVSPVGPGAPFPSDLLGLWARGKTSQPRSLLPGRLSAWTRARAVSRTEQARQACCVGPGNELSYRCRVPGGEPWAILTPTMKVGLSSSVVHVSQNAQRDGVHGQGHPARTLVEQGSQRPERTSRWLQVTRRPGWASASASVSRLGPTL